MIEVVSAVITNRDGSIFLQLRNPSRDFPLTWETPGGKVESDEFPDEALKRELFEELSLEHDAVFVGPQLWSCVVGTPNGDVRIRFYDVEVDQRARSFRLNDAIAWGFFTQEALNKSELVCTPGTSSFLCDYLWRKR